MVTQASSYCSPTSKERRIGLHLFKETLSRNLSTHFKAISHIQSIFIKTNLVPILLNLFYSIHFEDNSKSTYEEIPLFYFILVALNSLIKIDIP